MKPPRIQNFEGKNGPVKNQFEIFTEDGKYFQSYSTIIAFKPYDFLAGYYGVDPGKTILDNQWDYSRTTTKYLNRFLGTSGKAEIEKRIKAGDYAMADLNA
jgi:hypothetical protein